MIQRTGAKLLDAKGAVLATGVGVHQTALYDMILAWILFAILWNMNKKPRREGVLALTFGLYYGCCRLLEDSLRIDKRFGPFTGSQWTALTVAIICAAILIWWAFHPAEAPPDAGADEPEGDAVGVLPPASLSRGLRPSRSSRRGRGPRARARRASSTPASVVVAVVQRLEQQQGLRVRRVGEVLVTGDRGVEGSFVQPVQHLRPALGVARHPLPQLRERLGAMILVRGQGREGESLQVAVVRVHEVREGLRDRAVGPGDLRVEVGRERFQRVEQSERRPYVVGEARSQDVVGGGHQWLCPA